tara:strand:+ start:195 stop:533 length:339 start_codon:yes stop_codon:yes gene_type:complete
MKTASKKAKGRRLQNLLRVKLLEAFGSLASNDIKTAVMGESGEDLWLSPKAQEVIPFSFECKNTERLKIWQAIAQAEGNAEDRTPVVVFSRNRSGIYVSLELDNFIRMIKEK